MTLIDRIRDLIASGKTEQSLDELYHYVKENNADTIDHLVMLQNRMKTLQRNVQIGTMDEEAEAKERAKINDAILKLLPQLTPEYLAQFNRTGTYTAPAKNMNRLYLIGGGAVLLLIILIIALSRGGGEGDALAEDTEMTTNPDMAAGEASGPAEGTLLYDVMAAHGGYAVWKSEYNEANGQSTFRMEDDKTCQEIKNNQVVGTFQILTNSPDYITLYDADRQLYLRISDTSAEFHNEGESNWNPLFEGAWITPPDAPQ